MSNPKFGLWLVGGGGGVGSTAVLGLAALTRNLTDTTSLVTALPMFDGLNLAQPGQFVVGGHEIRKATLWDAVNEMHERANVFTHAMLAGSNGKKTSDQALSLPADPPLKNWPTDLKSLRPNLPGPQPTESKKTLPISRQGTSSMQWCWLMWPPPNPLSHSPPNTSLGLLWNRL
jgi:hypothetical protein